MHRKSFENTAFSKSPVIKEYASKSKQLKDHFSSGFLVTELEKSEPESKIQKKLGKTLNKDRKTSFTNRGMSDPHSKYEKIFNKILKIPQEKIKLPSQFELTSQKKIMSSIKSLENFEVISENEQKALLRNFSETVKSNFFTLKKTGIKFRKQSIRKNIAGNKLRDLLS